MGNNNLLAIYTIESLTQMFSHVDDNCSLVNCPNLKVNKKFFRNPLYSFWNLCRLHIRQLSDLITHNSVFKQEVLGLLKKLGVDEKKVNGMYWKWNVVKLDDLQSLDEETRKKVIIEQGKLFVFCDYCGSKKSEWLTNVLKRKNFFCNNNCQGDYLRQGIAVKCSYCQEIYTVNSSYLYSYRDGIKVAKKHYFCNPEHHKLFIQEYGSYANHSSHSLNPDLIILRHNQGKSTLVWSTEFLQSLLEYNDENCAFQDCDNPKLKDSSSSVYGVYNLCWHHTINLKVSLSGHRRRRQELLKNASSSVNNSVSEVRHKTDLTSHGVTVDFMKESESIYINYTPELLLCMLSYGADDCSVPDCNNAQPSQRSKWHTCTLHKKQVYTYIDQLRSKLNPSHLLWDHVNVRARKTVYTPELLHAMQEHAGDTCSFLNCTNMQPSHHRSKYHTCPLHTKRVINKIYRKNKKVG